MLNIAGDPDNSPEYKAARHLAKLASDSLPEISDSKQVSLRLFPSVQCFGETPQDIDLVVCFTDYRSHDQLFRDDSDRLVHSFCVVIEVKDHSPENVLFEGNQCSVYYNGERHDVTKQAEGQKYSLVNYIKKNSKSGKAPWVVNLIWLRRVSSKSLPNVDSNLIGMDITWEGFLCAASKLVTSSSAVVETFSQPSYLISVTDLFSKRLEHSKTDRKRLEAITKSILERGTQKYYQKLGKQLLIFRGRGGTGKTVRLIQLAHKAYEELGYRTLLLTYNKALVADLTRLFTILRIKDATGSGSIAVRTIHSFVHRWLVALGVITNSQTDFLENYEDYKKEALSLFEADAVSAEDISSVRASASRELSWDLVLIDESQDWPETERDLLYHLYGHNKVVIADGVDQFVRGVDHTNWRAGLDTSDYQIVSLTKSLRLKASLCQTVADFAEQIDFQNWNLEPLPEVQGGKVIVIVGDGLSEQFHRRIAATAQSEGNKPIDLLLCVPPRWVEDAAGRKQSTVAKVYRSWGWQVWDGVEEELRRAYPTSLDQYRIVQYDSCRGLEGWVVVCFGLDEFFEYKRSTPELSEQQKSDLFYDQEEASLEYAKRWLMIPLTRAIDTLVVHVNDDTSYVGGALKALYDRYPENIEWIEYK